MDGFEEGLKGLIPMFYGDEGPQGLESPESREKRHLMEMQETLDRYSDYFKEGFQWFLEHAPCREKLAKLYSEEGMQSISNCFNADLLSLGVALKLDSNDYVALYQQATQALQSGDLPLARSLFTTLIFLAFSFVEYWIGLALTLSRMEKIAETETVYKLAIFFNPFEPSPYLYYGHYLASLNDPRADLFLQQGKEVEEAKAKLTGETV